MRFLRERERFLRERERSLRSLRLRSLRLRCLRERLLREPRRRPPAAGATGAAGAEAFAGFLAPKRPDRNPVEAGAFAAGAGALIYYNLHN